MLVTVPLDVYATTKARYTFDPAKRSCFLPYMLLRMLKTSVRRLRPSAGAASPATLLAVVFGFVSESWLRVSLRQRERQDM